MPDAPRPDYIARACAAADDPQAMACIARGLGPGPFALVLLFVSPQADLERVARAAPGLPAAQVVGCTTAGEISDQGYDQGRIVAMGFPSRDFAAQALLVPDLHQISAPGLTDALLRARQGLATDHAGLAHEFSILLVDGLSISEDELAAALALGAGTMPMIGGSAGDGTQFRETFMLYGDRLLRNAAVLCVLRGSCPLRPINMDHLRPTELRLVVTKADPRARTIMQLNAEPAACEYARVLGKDPGQLDTFTFAAHPLAVRIGQRHHVRAIQRLLPSGELVFFAAIDEGVVLTVTEPHDLAGHLQGELSRLSQPVAPVAILAFDCILRRIEAQEKQLSGRISGLMRDHGVLGFSTYGEQFGAIHVNHTLTGYAFYPPGTVLPEDRP